MRDAFCWREVADGFELVEGGIITTNEMDSAFSLCVPTSPLGNAVISWFQARLVLQLEPFLATRFDVSQGSKNFLGSRPSARLRRN